MLEVIVTGWRAGDEDDVHTVLEEVSIEVIMEISNGTLVNLLVSGAGQRQDFSRPHIFKRVVVLFVTVSHCPLLDIADLDDILQMIRMRTLLGLDHVAKVEFTVVACRINLVL
jgi:hypothetical protein